MEFMEEEDATVRKVGKDRNVTWSRMTVLTRPVMRTENAERECAFAPGVGLESSVSKVSEFLV